MSTLTVLSELFPGDQPVFRTLSLIRYIDKVFDIEVAAGDKFVGTLDSNNYKKYHLSKGEFLKSADSLRNLVEVDTLKEVLNSIILLHREYEGEISKQIEKPTYNNITAKFSNGDPQNKIITEVDKQILRLNELFIPILDTAIKRYNQKMSDAVSIVRWAIALSLVVGSAIAFLLVRMFIKPIRALQLGTQKVAEAQYETVPITSNDEIADLTRAFNLMSEKLKQLDDMRMQMMSEISHEMRTPLQVIKAGCYSIVHTKDGVPLTQKQKDAVGMIHQATNRINNFVNSFLDIAKMEAGLMKFNFEQNDIVEIFTPLVQEAQLIAQTRQIKLDFLHEKIQAMSLDKERLSQALSNLLSNALKYTPDDGTITVQVKKVLISIQEGKAPSDCVRIDVKDTGVGIPEGDLGRLFNKFYQAKNVPLVKEKGSGLGLALVKHVSEAHGGKVGVQSEVGQGSTFTIILPIVKEI
jgi:two-component system, NtrC family, sensor histidine kinase GlrK